MSELPEALQRMQEIQAKFQKLGLDAENIGELTGLIQAYGEAQEEVQGYREIQFLDDAQELYRTSYMPRVVSERIDLIARFLRQFAEHVAEEIIHTSAIGNIKEEVDRIPCMTPDPHEAKARLMAERDEEE